MCPLLTAAALLIPPGPAEAQETIVQGGAFGITAPLAAWRFGAEEDRNFDRWPDGWLRRRGDGFPHFIPLEIDHAAFPAPADHPDGAAGLWVAANGGAAAAYSPPVRIAGRPAVRLTARVRTAGLDTCAAVVSLSLLDEHRVRLARLLSPATTGTSEAGGQIVEIGPTPPVEGAAWAVVGCHLVPGTGVSVGGEAWFDDLTLAAEPYLSLNRLEGGPTVAPDETFAVQATLSGVPAGAAAPKLAVQLQSANDPTGAVVDIPVEQERAETALTAVASIGPLAPGMWTVIATAGSGEGSRTCSLRVASADPADLPRGTAAGTSSFGWTLAEAPATPASAAAVTDAAAAAGAGWVRWTAGDPAADERLAAAVRSRLLRPVVRLTAENFGGRSDLATADALGASVDPATAVAAIAKPLAVHVRHWQIGRDDEPPALGGPFFPTAAGLLRGAAPGIVTAGPLDAGADLRVFSVGNDSARSAWRTLPAIDDPDDFLWALVQASAAGTGPVFAAEAYDPLGGLLSADGSPTRRFLPFRTAAALLGDAVPIGRIRVPGVPTRNEPEALAFLTPVGPIIAIRGRTAGSSVMQLGGQPEGRGPVGGRFVLAPAGGGRHQIAWSEEPRLLTGVSERLLRVRLGTRLNDEGNLQSSSEPQRFVVHVWNPHDDATTLTVRPDVPANWILQPRSIELPLSAGAAGAATFSVALPPDVSLGEHPVLVNVRLNGAADESLRIPRTASVRLDGLRLDVTDRRLPDGGWEVTQVLHNELSDGTTPTFHCDVQIPGAARVSRRTPELERGSHRMSFRLPPSATAGQAVWLRCSEIDGDRVLNRRWALGDPPPPSKPQ